MDKRYIGVDLHRNQFTVCVRLDNGRTYLREWRLEALSQFVKKLRPTDEVAVEITATRAVWYINELPDRSSGSKTRLCNWTTSMERGDILSTSLFRAGGIFRDFTMTPRTGTVAQ